MSEVWCKKCGGFIFSSMAGGHTCPPSWDVWPDRDDEEDATTVYALDAEEAAEKWAAAYDSDGEYSIVSGSEETVSVKSANGTIQKFEVSGESVPSYSALPV